MLKKSVNKNEIAKFLNTIKPQKWYNHAKVIGMALMSHKDPEKRQIIKEKLDMKYSDKKLHYSSEYEKYLKKQLEKQGFIVNNETIINSIENALTDKRTGKLNQHGSELILDLRNKLKDY
ncbi:MAG: hypothetical protein ACFFDK_09475 [Promethearchaeota archaeon]